METITLRPLESDDWESFEKNVIAALVPNQDQMMKAISSTNYRMAQWLKTRAVWSVSQKLQIPQKIIRKRILSFRFEWGNDGRAKVWFGMRGVPFAVLDPVAEGGGIRTRRGGHFFESKPGRVGFVVTSKKDHKLYVFYRTGKTWAGKNERGEYRTVTLKVEKEMLDWMRHEIDRPAFQKEVYKRLAMELKWRTEK